MKPSYSTILPSLVESSIVLSSLFHIVMEIISRKNLSPLLNKTKNPSNSQSVEWVDPSASGISANAV